MMKTDDEDWRNQGVDGYGNWAGCSKSVSRSQASREDLHTHTTGLLKA